MQCVFVVAIHYFTFWYVYSQIGYPAKWAQKSKLLIVCKVLHSCNSFSPKENVGIIVVIGGCTQIKLVLIVTHKVNYVKMWKVLDLMPTAIAFIYYI